MDVSEVLSTVRASIQNTSKDEISSSEIASSGCNEHVKSCTVLDLPLQTDGRTCRQTGTFLCLTLPWSKPGAAPGRAGNSGSGVNHKELSSISVNQFRSVEIHFSPDLFANTPTHATTYACPRTCAGSQLSTQARPGHTHMHIRRQQHTQIYSSRNTCICMYMHTGSEQIYGTRVN